MRGSPRRSSLAEFLAAVHHPVGDAVQRRPHLAASGRGRRAPEQRPDRSDETTAQLGAGIQRRGALDDQLGDLGAARASR